jgi:hypothetical protein
MSGQAVLTVRVMLALVLLVSVISKTRGRSAFAVFRHWVGELRVVPERLSATVAATLTAGEAVALALLVVPATAVAGLALTAAIMLVFAAAIAVIIRRGVSVPCRCFGGSSRPMGRLEIARNLVLALLAASTAAVALLTSAPGLSAPHASAPGAVAAIAAGAALAAAAVRLDRLPAAVSRRRPADGADRRRPPEDDEETVPTPGTEIGDFATMTTVGRRLGRGDIAGRTLVGFFTMRCGPCERLTPRFVGFAAGFPGARGQVLAVVVAAEHENATPQATRLDQVARVVVERPGGAMSAAFGVDAYPFVCLLDGHVIVAVDAEIGLPVT